MNRTTAVRALLLGALTSFQAPVFAEPPVIARLEPSAAAMLGAPQKDRFHVGGGARGTFEIQAHKYLGVEAHYGYFAFRLQSPGPISDYATYHEVGLGLRLHPAPDWKRADPWFSVDGSAVATGDKIRAAPAVGAGLDFRTGDVFRLGPFLRYQQIIDSHAADAHVLLLGLSLGFGGCDCTSTPPFQDSDGDGIADDRDRCPSRPGSGDELEGDDGCPREPLPPPRPQQPSPVVREPEPSASMQQTLKEIADRIFFESGSDRLTSSSKATLSRVTHLLKNSPNTHLVVEGHSDDRGSSEINQTLSQKRAEAVVAELIDSGIAPTRLRAVGYGATRPAVTGRDAKSRERNRRVQFVVEDEVGL